MDRSFFKRNINRDHRGKENKQEKGIFKDKVLLFTDEKNIHQKRSILKSKQNSMCLVFHLFVKFN